MSLNITDLLDKCWSKKTSPWKLKIIQNWPQIVGNIQGQARVEAVYEDTLVLGVYDTCWMQELHLLSEMIIKKVNNYIGTKQIKTIRLKYVQKHNFIKKETPIKAEVTNHLLSSKEQKALQDIADQELKVALHNFLNRCSHENSK